MNKNPKKNTSVTVESVEQTKRKKKHSHTQKKQEAQTLLPKRSYSNGAHKLKEWSFPALCPAVTPNHSDGSDSPRVGWSSTTRKEFFGFTRNETQGC